MSKANKLISIGWMGENIVYLNTPLEEAKRLYKEATGSDADDHHIQEIEFNRSFKVYDLWENDEGDDNHTPALGPKFNVRVAKMETSAGDDFYVVAERPDIPESKNWELGRITPYMSRSESQAEYMAAELDHFLNNPACEEFDPHMDLMMKVES